MPSPEGIEVSNNGSNAENNLPIASSPIESQYIEPITKPEREINPENPLEHLVLATGLSNIDMAARVSKIVGKRVQILTDEYGDSENRSLSSHESFRGQHVMLLQSTGRYYRETSSGLELRTPAHSFVDLLVMVDAAKRGGAKEITVIEPYAGFMRQDRKDRGRVAITGSMVADILEQRGVNSLITIDVHTQQAEGFIRGPWYDLSASLVFVPKLRQIEFNNLALLAPDYGAIKKTRMYAEFLGTKQIAMMDKYRPPDKKNEIEAFGILGNVKGCEVLIIDDIGDSFGTASEAARRALEEGATSVSIAVTHGIFSGEAINRLDDFKNVFITDTLPQRKEVIDHPKIQIISVAPLIAEAVVRHHAGGSMTALSKYSDSVAASIQLKAA